MNNQKVLWGEGLFLRPQHFQLQDQYHEHARVQLQSMLAPLHWGVRKLVVDEATLGNGIFQISTLEASFPDGAFLVAPAHDLLPSPRQFSLVSEVGDGCTVYVGVPHFNPYASNCDAGQHGGWRLPRFQNRTFNSKDHYTQAADADITVLNLRTQILFEFENLEEFVVLPVARLQKSMTGEFSLDPNFCPPLVDIQATPLVPRMLKRLLDIMLAKHVALSCVHKEAAKDVMSFRSTDIASFWLLHTINAAFAELKALAELSATHPWQLYRCLSRLFAELTTFSARYGLNELPTYQHGQPAQALLQLDDMIRDLLETVISVRYVKIPLRQSKPSVFVGSLEDERLVFETDYYLSVSANMPPGEITQTIPMRLKIGSPDDVEKMIVSAIPGVRLTQPSHTPASLPVRAGNYYFSLDPKGTVYERMMKARAVAIYVPEGFAELQLELIGVIR